MTLENHLYGGFLYAWYNRIMDASAKAFRELERFVYHHKPAGAASEMMAALVGVFVGLKPAGAVDFLSEQASATDLMKFREMVTRLGLKLVTDVEEVREGDTAIRYVMLYVAREIGVAQELAMAFAAMRESLDEGGGIKDLAEWARTTLEIGRLLGYPESAVEAFVRETEEWTETGVNGAMGARERKYTTVGGANRYYAHSLEHEREEFEAYDRPLNQAIDEWAPFTAERLQANANKRWLEF